MLKTRIENIFRHVANVLFPEHCIGCGNHGTLLCRPCFAKIPKAEDLPRKDIFSLYAYHDPYIRMAVKLLKYKNRRSLGAAFGAVLHDYLLEIIAEEQLFDGTLAKTPWIIIPIPLSQERLRTRGYNQTEIIGQAIIHKGTDGHFIMDSSILYKRHATESQVTIKDRKGRLANLKGSFAIRNFQNVLNQNCIIIDDVITTGATMLEAMRTVRQTGARRVIGVSIAH